MEFNAVVPNNPHRIDCPLCLHPYEVLFNELDKEMWPYKVYCGTEHYVCKKCIPLFREKRNECGECKLPIKKTTNMMSAV